jgi:hypothetical protein
VFIKLAFPEFLFLSLKCCGLPSIAQNLSDVGLNQFFKKSAPFACRVIRYKLPERWDEQLQQLGIISE